MADNKPTTILGAVQASSAAWRADLESKSRASLAARNQELAATHAVVPVVVPDAKTVEAQVAVDEGGAKKSAPVLKATSIVDEEHGVVMLVASLADAIDLDDDFVPAGTLVDKAHEFTWRGDHKFNANHEQALKGKLVESFTGVPILKSGRRLLAGEHIPDNDPIVSVGLLKAAGEATAWMIGVKPDDRAVVDAAKAGSLVGASWGGFAERKAV